MTRDREEVLDMMNQDLMKEQIEVLENISLEVEKEEVFSAYEKGLGLF